MQGMMDVIWAEPPENGEANVNEGSSLSSDSMFDTPLHVELEYTMSAAGTLVGRPPGMTEQLSLAAAPVPAGLAVAPQHNDQFQFQPIQTEPPLADALSVTGAEEMAASRASDQLRTSDDAALMQAVRQCIGLASLCCLL